MQYAALGGRVHGLGALLGALALAACGSSSSPARDAGGDDARPGDGGADAGVADECRSEEGSRLALTGVRAPDGEVLATGLYDRELGATCSFQPLAGGWHCVVFTPTLYRDAACTDPVGVSYSGELPRYHVIHDTACDEGVDTVYAVGDELPATDTYYTKSPDCEPLDDPNGRVYELGETVEPSVYVSAEITQLGTGRVRVQRFDGDDGSRYCHWAYRERMFVDTELDVPCMPSHDVDDTLRCMPASDYTTVVETDPACETSVRALEIACDSDVELGYVTQLVVDDATCPESQEVRVLGDELPAAYGESGGECRELEGRYHALGELVPPASLAPLTESWVGDGRLQRQLIVTPDGAGLFRGQWRDTELGFECRAGNIGDSMACVPAFLSRITLYTDDACTTSRDLALRDTGSCATVDGQFVSVDGVVHALGAELTAPVYQDQGGSCLPVEVEDWVLYEIGDAVEGLAELTEIEAP